MQYVAPKGIGVERQGSLEIGLSQRPNQAEQSSLQDEYNSNTMDMFQSFDSTTSAGYLDGFGIGHDGYTGNSLPNEIINTNEMPHDMPSRRIQVQHIFNYSNAKDHLASHERDQNDGFAPSDTDSMARSQS